MLDGLDRKVAMEKIMKLILEEVIITSNKNTFVGNIPQGNTAGLISGIIFIGLFSQEKPLW